MAEFAQRLFGRPLTGTEVIEETLGEEGPPVVNVNGPRYGAIHGEIGRAHV